jgi:hypothetical protein
MNGDWIRTLAVYDVVVLAVLAIVKVDLEGGVSLALSEVQWLRFGAWCRFRPAVSPNHHVDDRLLPSNRRSPTLSSADNVPYSYTDQESRESIDGLD